MNRQQAITRLLRDVHDDLRDYQVLHTLLDEQFAAALRHDAARLEDLARHVTALVDALQQRRTTRQALVQQLLGADAARGMHAVMELLSASSRSVLQDWWTALEALVRACKERNLRNCRLITDQNAILQRVLQGEEEQGLYAAA